MKVTLDITSKCNLHCKHCYNGTKYSAEKKIDDLSFGEVKRLLDNLYASGCNEINILGGEPFFRPDLIDILNYARNYNFLISLTTNATLISKPENEIIFKNKLLDFLMISIDGLSADYNDEIRGVGVFDKIKDNLFVVKNWCKKYQNGINLCISHCYMGQSYEKNDYLFFLKFLKNVGIDKITVFPIVKAGTILEHKEYLNSNNIKFHQFLDEFIYYSSEYYPELVFIIEERPLIADYFNLKFRNKCVCPERHIGCGVLNNCIYIKSDGTILPCGFVEFKDGFEEQKAGVFSEECTINSRNGINMKQIYTTPLFTDFISALKKYKKNEFNLLCRSCIYKKECMPCPFQNKEGEIFSECLDVLSNYNQIINKSHFWVIKQLFKNMEINDFFHDGNILTVEKSFKKSGKKSYFDYIREIIRLEKKGLIEVFRDGY